MDRRNIPRAHLDSIIYLELEPNNGGILLDLSPKGIKISVAHPLHTDTQIHFSFGATPIQQVQGIGRIAWIDRSKKSAGICFLHLSQESLSNIDELLKSASLEAIADSSSQAHPSAPSLEPEIAFSQHVATVQPEALPLTFESVRAIEPIPVDCYTVNGCGTLNEDAVGLDTIGELTVVNAAATEEASHTPKTEDTATESFGRFRPASASLRINTYESNAEPVSSDTEKYTQSTSSDAATPGRDYEPVAQPPDSLSGLTAEPAVAKDAALAPQPCGLNDPLPIFTLRLTYQCPPSRLALMGKAILPALNEIGWGVENDWHVIAGMVLMVAGFIALWQQPPLVPLAVALWIAGASVLTGKKQPRQDTDL